MMPEDAHEANIARNKKLSKRSAQHQGTYQGIPL